MFKSLAWISLIFTLLISILTIASRFVPGGIILIWRTYWELAHFGVLFTTMLLVFHIVQMKETQRP
jgi:hypothetical protein